MLVSSSEGFWREGEFAAILLSEGEDILTAGDDMTSVEELAVKYVGSGSWDRGWLMDGTGCQLSQT